MKKQEFPRKLKKRYLGVLRSKNKIAQSIKRYEQPCYNCGCLYGKTLNHNVGYPEIWVETFCDRCGTFIGGADNSRYEHLSDIIYEMICNGVTFNESVKYVKQL